MRTTVTFILRLLVDESEPEALRGVLQMVASNEEHTFTDAQSLLNLLHKTLTDWLQAATSSHAHVSNQ